MKLNWNFILVILGVTSPLLTFVLAVIWDRHQRKRIEKPPQAEKLLRPPGYSLSVQLDEIWDHIFEGIMLACLLCSIAGALALMPVNFLGANVPELWILVCSGLFAVLGAWLSLRAFRRFREAQNIRLGLRGEQACAEALNEAAAFGFRTFHDLPASETWNIDHVAIGTRGIFLIETKARRRRATKIGAEHEVSYDGEKLKFPKGEDAKPIEQAKRNAAWLSNYLEKKTGEPVRVEALVILPGWFVKTTTAKGNSPVKVMNANYLVKFLQGQNEKIDPPQVRRIIAAIDEKCRTLEF